MVEIRLKVSSLEEVEGVVKTLQEASFSFPVRLDVALFKKEIEKQYQLEKLLKAKRLLIEGIEREFEENKKFYKVIN